MQALSGRQTSSVCTSSKSSDILSSSSSFSHLISPDNISLVPAPRMNPLQRRLPRCRHAGTTEVKEYGFGECRSKGIGVGHGLYCRRVCSACRCTLAKRISKRSRAKLYSLAHAYIPSLLPTRRGALRREGGDDAAAGLGTRGWSGGACGRRRGGSPRCGRRT